MRHQEELLVKEKEKIGQMLESSHTGRFLQLQVPTTHFLQYSITY